MKNKWRGGRGLKLLCVLLALLFGLSGCREDVEIKLTAGLGEGELFQVEGKSCMLSEARLFLMNQKNRYEASYGPNIWEVPVGRDTFADYMKNELNDFLTRLKTMVLMAEERSISLDEEDESRAAAAAAEYMELLPVQAASYTGITREQLENVYREYRLAQLLVEKLTADVNEEISDDAARVIEVQQVVFYLQAEREGGTAVPISDSEKEELKGKAAEVAALAAQGEVFSNLQEVYSDEEVGNIRVSRYDVEPEWEQAVFSLASGEVSGVVETPEALYVVRCVSNMLPAETQANKEVIRERQRAEVFYAEYDAFVQGLHWMWDTESWNRLDFTDEIPECPADFYAIYEQYFG